MKFQSLPCQPKIQFYCSRKDKDSKDFKQKKKNSKQNHPVLKFQNACQQNQKANFTQIEKKNVFLSKSNTVSEFYHDQCKFEIKNKRRSILKFIKTLKSESN